MIEVNVSTEQMWNELFLLSIDDDIIEWAAFLVEFLAQPLDATIVDLNLGNTNLFGDSNSSLQGAKKWRSLNNDFVIVALFQVVL